MNANQPCGASGSLDRWLQTGAPGAVRRFTDLAADDRRLLVAAYASLLLTDIALRVLGFRRLMAWGLAATGTAAAPAEAAAAASNQRVTAAQHRRAGRFAYWLEVASRRHWVRARCLHRSLALHLWLRRKRLPSRLRIGVRKAGGELLAHAWIEMDGRVVNDSAAAVAVFSVLPGLDAPEVLWRQSVR